MTDLIEYETEANSDRGGALTQRDHPLPYPADPPPADAPEAAREAWQTQMTAWRKWRMNILFDELTTWDEGHAHPSEANVLATFKWHPDWHDMFERDDFRGVDLIRRPIPGAEAVERRENFEPREITDVDITSILVWLQRNGIPSMKAGTVLAAVSRICAENSYDALKAYMAGCRDNWDGIARIDDWHDRYFVSEYDDRYSREVGPIVLMALAARALYPGCFLKMMPIYQGDQDVSKSSGLAALVPDPRWFSDSLPGDIRSKDAAIQLQGHFIVEAGELTQFKRSEINELKVFLTKRYDKYRPPYGRHYVEQPRRCVIFGTTNDDDFLRDATGASRYYPIWIIRVDVEAIKRDRGQLFGEAAVRLEAALREGREWWQLSPEAKRILEETRDDNSDDDPFSGLVLSFVEGLDEVAIPMLMEQAYTGPDGRLRQGLDIPRDRREKKDSHRITDILKRAGWARSGQFTRAPWRGQKRWVPKQSLGRGE